MQRALPSARALTTRSTATAAATRSLGWAAVSTHRLSVRQAGVAVAALRPVIPSSEHRVASQRSPLVACRAGRPVHGLVLLGGASPRVLHASVVASSQARSISTTGAGAAATAAVVATGETVAAVVAADPTPMGWWPSQLMEMVFVVAHDATGWSWAFTIMGVVFGFRILLAPVIVYQLRNVSRLAWIKDDMEMIQKNYQAMGGLRGPPQAYDKMNESLKALYAKHDCNPMKSLATMFIQAPVMISIFLSLRRMALEYPSFQTGGMLWFQDLSIMDPYYTLPIAAGVLTFITIEFGTDTGQSMANTVGNMKVYMRAFALSIIPITIFTGFPNSVLLYWVTQASVSLGQSLILKIPGLKPAMGILEPPPPKKAPAPRAEVSAPVIPTTVFATRKQVPTKAAAAAAAADSDAAPVVTAAKPKGKGNRVKRRSFSTQSRSFHTRQAVSGGPDWRRNAPVQ